MTYLKKKLMQILISLLAPRQMIRVMRIILYERSRHAANGSERKENEKKDPGDSTRRHGEK